MLGRLIGMTRKLELLSIVFQQIKCTPTKTFFRWKANYPLRKIACPFYEQLALA